MSSATVHDLNEPLDHIHETRSHCALTCHKSGDSRDRCVIGVGKIPVRPARVRPVTVGAELAHVAAVHRVSTTGHRATAHFTGARPSRNAFSRSGTAGPMSRYGEDDRCTYPGHRGQLTSIVAIANKFRH
jgi:hypothetical protein